MSRTKRNRPFMKTEGYTSTMDWNWRTTSYKSGRRMKAYTINGLRGKSNNGSGARSILLKNNANRSDKKSVRNQAKQEIITEIKYMKVEIELTKEQQDWLNQETLRLLAEKQANSLFYNFKHKLTTDKEFENQLYNHYKEYVINSENKLFTSRFDDQIDDIEYFSDWTDTDEFKEVLTKRLVKTMESIDELKLKEQLEEAVKDFIESNSLEDILGEEQLDKIRTKITKLLLK